MRTFKRILGVLLIFLFGVFVGAVLMTGGAMQKAREIVLGGPEAVMDVVVHRLDRELKLDDEQKRKLQGILDDARIQLRQSHAKIRPEVEQTFHDTEDRIRAILYPEQVKKFDQIVSKSREKWKTMEPSPAATPTAEGTPLPEATPAPAAAATPAPVPAPEAVPLPSTPTPPPAVATPARVGPTPIPAPR
jgi:hypothetical protein